MKRKPLVFAALFLLTFTYCDSKYHHRLTKVECNSSGKSVSDLYCHLRAYDRRKPVANFGFVLKRKIADGMFSIIRYHRTKYDQPYTKDLAVDKIEICKIFLGSADTVFFKQVLEWANKLSKDLTKLCNFEGELKFVNITIPQSSLTLLLPAGLHQTTLTYYDDKDLNIFNITYWAAITK